MCSYYYFIDEINEEIKNDTFFYVNFVYVCNIQNNDSYQDRGRLTYSIMDGIKRCSKKIVEKIKGRNTNPIVPQNESKRTNKPLYPLGFKKWLKARGFVIKEGCLYYDTNLGIKKRNYAKSYGTSILELLYQFNIDKNTPTEETFSRIN
jgi:hypothetical protein